MYIRSSSSVSAKTNLSDSALSEFYAVDEIVRRIPAQARSVDPVERAKSHWLGRFYVSHLKRYWLLRTIVNRGWVTLFPIYRQFARRLVNSRSAPKPMPLVAQSAFVRANALKSTDLATPHEVITPVPRVYPQRDQHYLRSPHDRYVFPATFVTEVPGALVQGGTNIVVAKGSAIHHDLFTKTEDFTSEESHDRMDLDVRAGTVVWRAPDPQPELLEIAASFLDACALNYAHWLTEVAPRIALLCAKPEFDGVPLIINDGLHPNIMESLFALAGGRHPIIALPLGRSVRVTRLYLVSCAGYVPFEPRGGIHVAGMSHGRFSRIALEAMRHACFASTQRRDTPSRIFLRRNSGVRRLLNSDEIESMLIGQGFTVVDPEKLSFAMQVQLFRQAKVIIGATGAAMANIIFSDNRVRIAILISRQEEVIYWYWQNIANASGKVVSYVFGSHVEGAASHVHADFKVAPEAVNEFVNNLEHHTP